MSYRSEGIVSNGLPSLYDEVTTAETTDKGLSILSAVTGKEVTKPSGQHNSSVPPRTVFLYTLFIATMLGFAYWQYNSYENGIGVATVVAPIPVKNKLPQPTLAATSPIASTPAPQTKMDTALIETVKEKSAAPTPLTVAKPDEKPTVATKAPLIVGQMEKPAIPPLATTPVIATKAGVNEIATKAMPAKEVIDNAPPVQVAPTEKLIRSAELKPTNSVAEVAEHTQPVQRSTTTTTTTQDPDEKLLEGILRLIKRDRPTDAAQGRAAK